MKKTDKKTEKEAKTANIPYMMNRELSWLKFNERVLNEAGNPEVPLAERLTFAAIYQSNLDEFYGVRVGTLMDQMESSEVVRENKTNMTSEEQVKAILKVTRELDRKKAVIYEQLMGELEPKGVRLINFNKLSAEEGRLLEAYFDNEIAPYLSANIVSKQQPFPFLKNKDIYAAALLVTKGGKSRTAIIPCSNNVFKRLIDIPTRKGTFMLSEELILHFLPKLFKNYEVKEKSLIRVTRNADIDTETVYDEDMEYRKAMENLIKQRKRMNPVRMELSRELNKKMISSLCRDIHVDKEHVFLSEVPLDMSFVSAIQSYLKNTGQEDIFYQRRTPRMTQQLDDKEPLIPQIMEKDVLLSYPFESIRPFIKLLYEAAKDETVVSVKMTLYRLADKSQVVDALVEAAENGKEVVVLVELRARFDEESNIEYSRRLEEAGCRVIYGLVQAAGKRRLHRHLRLRGLQGALQALPDFQKNRGGRILHHAGGNWKLQRENIGAVYGPLADYGKSGYRKGIRGGFRGSAERRDGGGDPASSGGAEVPAEQGARYDRGRNRACEKRGGRLHRNKNQLSDRQGDY